jgi:4-amino-4-deoxy-L-arabinose transferase-like glycosyltransferase
VPHARPTILLAVLSAALFLTFLGRRDIVTSHEARVVQTAREMAQAGWPWSATPASVPAVRLGTVQEDGVPVTKLLRDPEVPRLSVNPWVVPVLNDEVRLQKPPLPYWATAVVVRVFGDWSEALARLIPAVLGALSTGLVYDLGRRLIGRRAAAPAAFAWVTSYFVPDEFRKAMADPYVAFFVLLAVWGWVRASVTGSAAALLAFYVAVGLGLLAKGPVLFVHLGIAIVLFHALHRRRRVPARGGNTCHSQQIPALPMRIV